MKVLLLFHHFRTLRDRGGLRSQQIATYLARRGHQVAVIVPGVDPLTERRHPGLGWAPSVWERLGEVWVVRVNSLSNRRSSRLSRISYFVSSSLMQFLYGLLAGRADVVVCTSMPPTLMVLAFLLARLRRAPLVVDVRDLTLDFATEIGYLRRGLAVRLMMWLERQVLCRAEVVVTISEGLRDMVIAKGANHNRVHFVPIGYDQEAYEEGIDWNRDIRAAYGIGEGFIVLFAGTMSNTVDVPTLLKAARATRDRCDVIWVLAGAGERYEEYRRYVEENGLNCLLIGEVPKADVILLCRAAGVCLYPLRDRPMSSVFLGNKVFDYLGSGTPLIFSGPAGDISRILEASGAGLWLPAEDPAALAREVLALAKDAPRRQALKQKAKRYITEHFLTRQSMERLESLINECVDAS